MKEKIQENINQIKKLATSSCNQNASKATESIRTNDSLSKAVRNSKEADIFLAELDAAFKVAKTTNN